MPKQDKVQIINQRRRRPTDSLGVSGAGGAFVPPGTITLTTGNTVGTTHTHALDILASWDPGAAESVLKTNDAGWLNLVRLYLDDLYAELGADLVMQLGDDGGANELIINDSNGDLVADIASDGEIYSIGGAWFNNQSLIRFTDGAPLDEIKRVLTLRAMSTGTTEDGFGTRLRLEAEAADGFAKQVGEVDAWLVDATGADYKGAVGLYVHGTTGSRYGLILRNRGDYTLALQDAAGANKLSITDSDDAEVASIDSDGVINIGASGRIQFADGTVTGTAVAGAVEYDDGTFYGTEVETRRAFSMSSGQITATTTVANTTTETTVFTGAIAADELRVGKVYRVGLYGSFSTQAASQALTLRSYVGSTKVGEIVLAPGNVTDEPWRGDITFTVRSTGATGSVSTFTAMFVEDEHDAMTEATTVDTTAAEDITLTAEWGAASAGNVFKVTQGYMEVLH